MSTIPAPTTTTTIIDAQEVTRTTWTVSDYTLTRVQHEEAPHAYWRTGRLNNNVPNVDEDTAGWLDDTPATYSVNWSARGDRSPEEAFEYAARIMAAANAARVFTAIRAENK